MPLTLGIHAVALLNICDYAVRSGQDSPEFVGGLFGEIREHEIIINHTFELIKQGALLDMDFLQEKSEQFRTVYTGQRLIGWYVVGATKIEPWMEAIQEQLSQTLDSPILGLFSVPFDAHMGSLPFSIYDSQLRELNVKMKVDEIEQIALRDILSSQGTQNTLNSQAINDTRSLILLHRHLAQFQAELADAEPRRQAEMVSVIQQLCRTHDFSDTQEVQAAEEDVLALLISSLITRGDLLYLP